jgi:HEPN domain-containing protein
MSKDTAEAWFTTASHDLEAAQILLNEYHYHDVIGLLIEQGVEKSLKGLLVLHDEEPPRTHNLVELIGVAMKHLPELIQYAEHMPRISAYYVEASYPAPGWREHTRDELAASLGVAWDMLRAFERLMEE